LRWSEAEALALAKLARRFNRDGYAKVQMAATRTWLVDALGKGYVVDASCHGRFDRDDFRNSVLVLARDQELSLGELLSHQIDLRGLRLLILSACQTMLLDLRGAVNQVRSLASGVLQSGARATLGSLWPVNDLATYLLMARFAQEWFPQMDTEPPAFALARAQRWLRTVTNRELSRWGETRISILPQKAPLEGGENRIESRIAGDLILEALEVGESSERYDSSQASEFIRMMGVREDEPEEQPFRDPFYWAGFQITGW
jgi:CHAT domain-containing protein